MLLAFFQKVLGEIGEKCKTGPQLLSPPPPPPIRLLCLPVCLYLFLSISISILVSEYPSLYPSISLSFSVPRSTTSLSNPSSIKDILPWPAFWGEIPNNEANPYSFIKKIGSLIFKEVYIRNTKSPILLEKRSICHAWTRNIPINSATRIWFSNSYLALRKKISIIQ